MADKQKIDKGLKHLQGSEKIIGNIVAYCVSAHKADPSEKTMTAVRQYVSDTANSVCSHVLTIAQSINTMIDKQTKEIQEMSFEVEYVNHRLRSHQTFMSDLYMTKFQTCPRPAPQIKIMREIIPTDQLPKYARPKKPWVRQTEFNYDIFNPNRKKKKQQLSAEQEGNSRAAAMKKQKSLRNQIAPHAAVQSINPYQASMDADKPIEVQRPISPKSNGKSMYQQQQEARKKKKVSANANVAAPPMMSSVPPPSFGAAAPPSMSQMEDDGPSKKPPPVPPVPPN